MAVEPNRWGIIYNPKAGSRKTQKRWNEIRSYMENRKVVFDYVQSEGFGSVERLARTLANNGYRTIVIVGGDGAINDAINGIMTSMVEDKTNIAFGIIPNGIGNDFAKYWGLDEDNYKAAVDWIINRRLRKIDVGRCNYFDGEKHTSRYFLNAIYIGLGARIVQISDGTRRFWGIRELSFAASMFLLLFERKLYRTHLCIFKSVKFTPPTSNPMGGMMTSATMEDTILPKAPPMMTPTAMSMTFPRIANALKSCKKLLFPIFFILI